MERLFGSYKLYASSRYCREVSSKKNAIRSNKKYISFYSSTEPWRWYSRGDLLVVTNYQSESIRAGDNVVFQIEGRDIPIVHRVIRLHER